MKLTCQRISLTTAMTAISALVNARTPKPALKCVYVQCRDGGLTLVGSDSEIGMRYQVKDAVSDKNCEILIPVERLLGILRSLVNDVVNITISGTKISIKSGFSNFNLSGSDAADFPPVGTFDAESYFTAPAGELKKCIKRTVFAVDEVDPKLALGGVHHRFADKLILEATDRRRGPIMPCNYASVGDVTKPAVATVVPAKTLNLVNSCFSDDSAQVKISIEGNHIKYQSDGITIISGLVAGKFPDLEKAMKETPTIIIDLVASTFNAAVRQSMLIRNAETAGVEFVFEKGNLKLQSKAADVGDSVIELPIPYDGESVTLKIDPRYIADFLRVIEPGSPIQMKFIDNDSIICFCCEDYRYFVCPIGNPKA